MNIRIKTTMTNNGLRHLQQRIEQAQAAPAYVPLTDVLTDDFTRRHTRFQTLEELLVAGGFDSLEEIEGADCADFIAANTDFGSWDKMKEAALREYAGRKFS